MDILSHQVLVLVADGLRVRACRKGIG
jgi:hypothetical protein